MVKHFCTPNRSPEIQFLKAQVILEYVDELIIRKAGLRFFWTLGKGMLWCPPQNIPYNSVCSNILALGFLASLHAYVPVTLPLLLVR